MIEWASDGAYVVFETPDGDVVRIPLDEYLLMARKSWGEASLAHLVYLWRDKKAKKAGAK